MKTSQFKDYSELPLPQCKNCLKGAGNIAGQQLWADARAQFSRPEDWKSNGGSQGKIHLLGGGKYCWGQDFMRKHKFLIGWPMRDPKRYRFAVPNKIWEHKLKPIEFMIFSYLCYWRSNQPTGIISPDDIARGICVTAGTVKKYLSILIKQV